jgi:hypothetical protein
MDLMDLLKGQLSGGLVDQLSQHVGADSSQTASAAEGIISTLLGGLSKNAASDQGANALTDALANNHSGGILSDLLGAVTQGGSKATDGAGMLKHILGDKAGGAVDMISNMSGLNQGQTGNLFQILAPLVMNTLGQAKQQNGLDASGIASLLSQVVSGGNTQNQAAQNPLMSMVSQFLDKDKDGSVMDDLAGMAMNMLTGKK